MTPEELEKLEPGPVADSLVAERVMGWRRDAKPPSVMVADYFVEPSGRGRAILSAHPGIVPAFDWFSPSRDIAAAWEVVERVKDLKGEWPQGHGTGGAWWSVEWCCYTYRDNRRIWSAGYRNSIDYEGDGWALQATALTAPLAICRAALLAIAKTVQPPEPR